MPDAADVQPQPRIGVFESPLVGADLDAAFHRRLVARVQGQRCIGGDLDAPGVQHQMRRCQTERTLDAQHVHMLP